MLGGFENFLPVINPQLVGSSIGEREREIIIPNDIYIDLEFKNQTGE